MGIVEGLDVGEGEDEGVVDSLAVDQVMLLYLRVIPTPTPTPVPTF